MAIPSEDLARQRVDNMANGWLATGARAVFAYGWNQQLNYPQALITAELDHRPAVHDSGDGRRSGSPKGFVGWQNNRFASERTPGAVNHLDPHRERGLLPRRDRRPEHDRGRVALGRRLGDDEPPPPPGSRAMRRRSRR